MTLHDMLPLERYHQRGFHAGDSGRTDGRRLARMFFRLGVGAVLQSSLWRGGLDMANSSSRWSRWRW